MLITLTWRVKVGRVRALPAALHAQGATPHVSPGQSGWEAKSAAAAPWAGPDCCCCHPMASAAAGGGSAGRGRIALLPAAQPRCHRAWRQGAIGSSPAHRCCSLLFITAAAAGAAAAVGDKPAVAAAGGRACGGWPQLPWAKVTWEVSGMPSSCD